MSTTEIQISTDEMKYRTRKKIIKLLSQLKGDMITASVPTTHSQTHTEIDVMLDTLKFSSFGDKGPLRRIY